MKHPVIVMFAFAALIGVSFFFNESCRYLVLLLVTGIFFGTIAIKKGTSTATERHSQV